MKEKKKKRKNEAGVSAVIGSLLLVSIVVMVMTSMIFVFQSYTDAAKKQTEVQMELVDSQLALCYKFMEYIDNISFDNPGFQNNCTPCNSMAPVISDEYPPNESTGIWPIYELSVYVDDPDSEILAVQFYISNKKFTAIDSISELIFVQSGQRVTWSESYLSKTDAEFYNVTFKWYVIVTDGCSTTISDQYWFTG